MFVCPPWYASFALIRSHSPTQLAVSGQVTVIRKTKNIKSFVVE